MSPHSWSGRWRWRRSRLRSSQRIIGPPSACCGTVLSAKYLPQRWSCAAVRTPCRVLSVPIPSGGFGYDASADSHRLADESEPVLIGLLSDDSPSVVMSAIFSLGHLRRGSTPELARVQAHPASEVREALAYVLGMHDDAISTLIELSTDHDAGTRDWATFGIGTQTDVDTADIRDALTARLEDQDVDVRGEAMVGLARRGDERAVRPIAEGLERGEELAVDAAGELPRLQFVPQLERLAVERPTDPFVTEALFKCRSASE